MNPATTLKELLKPPFYHNNYLCGEIYCENNKIDNGKLQLLQTRAWLFFQDFKNGGQLYDDFMDFVVTALNEKWEHDFGEPLKWRIIKRYPYPDLWVCPKCKISFSAYYRIMLHCPSCGKRLFPPEEAHK